MKRKTMILIGGLILAVLLFLYLLPLLEEFRKVELNLMGLCIGTGCYSSSSTYSFGFGSVGCSGYQVFGFFCPTDAEKYCRYMRPFDSREKCLCELKDYGYGYKSHRFCPKNNLCYSNSFEYDFGCSEDLKRTCKEVERDLNTKPAFSTFCYSRAIFRGLISDESDCLRTYIYIYNNTGNQQKRIAIFEKGTIDWKGKSYIGLNDLCKLICTNCNSSLCNKGNICEYATSDSRNS